MLAKNARDDHKKVVQNPSDPFHESVKENRDRGRRKGVRWIKRRKERGEHGAVLAKRGLADRKGTGVIIVPVKRGAGRSWLRGN